MQELYQGVLLGVTPVRDQKKKQDWAEKLNCDTVATKVSVDSIRNSEPEMAFQSCLE